MTKDMGPRFKVLIIIFGIIFIIVTLMRLLCNWLRKMDEKERLERQEQNRNNLIREDSSRNDLNREESSRNNLNREESSRNNPNRRESSRNNLNREETSRNNLNIGEKSNKTFARLLYKWFNRMNEGNGPNKKQQNHNRKNLKRYDLNRDEHNREVRIRMREARNQINISTARSHHNVPSSSAQSSTQPSPYLQYHIEQTHSDRSRTMPTLHGSARPNRLGPTQHELTRSGSIQSTQQILSDQTGNSPSDVTNTNRNLHNKIPNPPPPSYRDLFPSDSSYGGEFNV